MKSSFLAVFIGICLLLFQNCQGIDAVINPSSESSSPSSKNGESPLASQGNGDTYDGKLIAYYRYVPNYKCGGNPSPVQKISRPSEGSSQDSPLLLQESCDSPQLEIQNSRVTDSPFQNQFLIYNYRIFEHFQNIQLANQIPKNLGELVCRDSFANPNYELVVHYDREAGEAWGQFFGGLSTSPFKLARVVSLLEGISGLQSLATYQSSELHLEVETTEEENHARLHIGKILQSAVPLLTNLNLECAIGGALDLQTWKRQILSQQYISELKSASQGVLSWHGSLTQENLPPIVHRYHFASNETNPTIHLKDLTALLAVQFPQLQKSRLDVSQDSVLGYQFRGSSYFITTPQQLNLQQNQALQFPSISYLWSPPLNRFFQLNSVGSFARTPRPLLSEQNQELIFAVHNPLQLGSLAKNSQSLQRLNLKTGETREIEGSNQGALRFFYQGDLHQILVYSEASRPAFEATRWDLPQSQALQKYRFEVNGCDLTVSDFEQNQAPDNEILVTAHCPGHEELWSLNLNSGTKKKLHTGNSFSLLKVPGSSSAAFLIQEIDSQKIFLIRSQWQESTSVETPFSGAQASSVVAGLVDEGPRNLHFHSHKNLLGLSSSGSLVSLGFSSLDQAALIQKNVCSNASGEFIFSTSIDPERSALFTYSSVDKIFRGYIILPDLSCREFNRFFANNSQIYNLTRTQIGFAFTTGRGFYNQEELFFVALDGRPPLKIGSGKDERWQLLHDEVLGKLFFFGLTSPLQSLSY